MLGIPFSERRSTYFQYSDDGQDFSLIGVRVLRVPFVTFLIVIQFLK